MQVTVKLAGVLKRKSPPDDRLELADGATLDDAVQALDIPAESIQVILVNGSIERNRSRPLAQDDELSILAPVGGG